MKTKKQKRDDKVALKKRERERRARTLAHLANEKVRKANEKIHEAVEVAIGRAVSKLSINDLMARELLASLLKDRLFVSDVGPGAGPNAVVDDGPSVVKASASCVSGEQSISSGDGPIVLNKSGFDRSAWGTV